MGEQLVKAAKHSWPLLAATLILLGVHFIIFSQIRVVHITATELLMIYAFLFVVFTFGQMAVYSEGSKNLNSLQQATKRNNRNKLVLSAIFLIFISTYTAEPVYMFLQFLVPYLILSFVEFKLVQRIKSNF